MTSSRIRQRWTTPLIGALVFLFACWQFLGAVDEPEFHRDEARWIHRGNYVREILDPFGSYWDEDTWIDSGASMDEQYRLRAQPPFGSYMMGIGFLLQGQPLPDIGFWNMDHDDAWNAEAGNMPTEAMLTSARRTTAVISALTVLAVFAIGNRLTNIVGGLIGALYLTIHPLMVYLATFAGSDATLGLTIALSAVGAARLADSPSWPRAIVLGGVLGLGTSTKLSPFGLAVGLGMMGMVLLVASVTRAHRWKLPPRALGWQLQSLPLISAFVFLLSYPYLWRDPIANTQRLVSYRTDGMDIQGSLWPQVAVDSPAEAIERMWNRFTGPAWSVIGRFTDTASPVEMLVALLGAAILFVLVARRGLWSPTAMIAAILGGITAITIMGMGVDWARYHLPILITMSVCIGIVPGMVSIPVLRPKNGNAVHREAADGGQTPAG